MRGHLWTIGANLRHQVVPHVAPIGAPWSIAVDEECRLTGMMRHEEGSDTVVVVVHGLGGDLDSAYCVKASRAIERAGWSCLRVNLRGADGRGDDVYHAGLVSDLAATVAAPELQRYQRVFVVGYSLGGHLALRYALDPDPRVRAVAAVGSPLLLAQSCKAIDRARAFVYRHHVLRSLKQAYRAMAKRRDVPTPVRVVDRLSTIRGWDHHVVVPRHGFESVEHYHASQSAGPKLRDVKVPALYVGSLSDPMVPPETVRDALANAPNVESHLVDTGGHVAFPPVSLGGPPRPVAAGLLHWFERLG